MIKKTINKILLLTIIILSILIITKNNIELKNKIHHYIYEDNISFMTFKKIYSKYLGGTYIFNKNKNISPVFNNKINYKNKEVSDNKIILEVSNNYLVPNMKSGIVTYIGPKDYIGNTIIIQTDNKIDIWYGNIDNIAVNLYDYIEKGQYLGEANDNKLIIAYSKEGDMLNADKYFNN